MQFYDGKFGGYLMICSAAAFMAVSVFEEVIESTGMQLMKTRFRLATGQQLYIETATLIQVIMQSAFVIGPILGGYLSDRDNSKSASMFMAVVSVNVVALYAIFGLVVHCLSKWDSPDLILDTDAMSDTSFTADPVPNLTSEGEFKLGMQAIQSRKRKNDDLGTLLRILTDHGSAEEEKGGKRPKKQTYLPQASDDTDQLVKKNI